MNSYWQVLRTYLWRPRFWVLGFFYLLLVWGLFWWKAWDGDYRGRGQASFSATYTALAACFLALHVRRQFTTDSALLVPGYALPHLVVGVLISSLLWLIVPTAAILSGNWPPGALAFHAGAAILMTAVACWPRAIVLLVAVPVMLVWTNSFLPPGDKPVMTQLLDGQRPVLANLLVGAALLAQFVAGFLLLRMPRRGVTTNDEFTLDSKASVQEFNPLIRWFHSGRDAAAERLLEARVFASIQRWRVPVATSFAQLSIPVVCVLAAAAIGLANGNWQGWSAAATAMTCAVLLFVPLGPWHARRHAMSQEILLRVTRPRYFRQIILSMALDMALWMTVASAIIAVVALAFVLNDRPKFNTLDYLIGAAIYFSPLWSMAIFVFGVGLATMRWPLWLPIVAGVALVWFFGVWVAIVTFHTQNPKLGNEFVGFAIFIAMNVVVGLLLTLSTYRRWVRNDVA